MKCYLTRAFALSIMLFWDPQSIAQPSGVGEHTTLNVQFSVDRPVEVERASLGNKILWAAMTFISPDPKYELTPLFGYRASQISNRMPSALIAAAEGDVRMAILTRQESDSSSSSVGSYIGRGVQLSDAVTSDGDWDHFQAENIADDDIIAFSRPLRDVEPGEEFIATSRLWGSVAETGEMTP